MTTVKQFRLIPTPRKLFSILLWFNTLVAVGKAFAEMEDPNDEAKDDHLADCDTNDVNRQFLSLLLWVHERVGWGSNGPLNESAQIVA